MDEWRADMASRSVGLRESGGTPARPRVAQRREEAYAPPEHFSSVFLGELLPPSRPISPEQQERLGFAAVTPRGPRLWCAGDVSLLQRPCIAIVGTRRVTPGGAARSRRLARELAAAGVVVVSGLAKGVDTEALSSAIAAGGRVVAVIGTPLEKAFPAENKRLQEQIYREHLLVSQFEPGSSVFRGNFPTRNKLMAALSDGTAVIEAGDTSGALHQTAECVRLGRWLYIAHSLLNDPSVTWPADFLRYPVTRTLRVTADILETLNLRK